MEIRSSLERQIFTWSEYDMLDEDVFLFMGVTLTQPVGEFPAGTKFEQAVFNVQKSYVRFLTEADDEDGHTFALNCTVGEKL